MNYLRKPYFFLFNYLADGKKTISQEIQQQIHRHLVVILTTSILMWSYVFVANYEMQSPIPFWVGIFCSVIHLLSPLVWKVTDEVLWPLFFAIVAGIIHQSSFSFYSGGLQSETLIWLTVHPMLGSIVGHKRGLFLFGGLSLGTALCFLVLVFFGFEFPNLLSERGHSISQVFLLLGYFLIAFSGVAMHIHVDEKNKQRLEVKNSKIQNLLRVLVHDISNPLSVADYQLNSALRKEEYSESLETRIKKSLKALEVLASISNKVRELHSDEILIENRRLEKCDIDECFDHMMLVFEEKFASKKICFKKAYIESFEFDVSKEVFLNQILANLVSNAIKFTPTGGDIEFIARKMPTEIQIGIRDTGVGMSQNLIEELRKKGRLRSTPGEAGESGTGFGLMIVNSFVVELGAELEISSKEKTSGEQEHGTLFLVKMPI